jgi:hypothetical protein
VAHSGRPGFGLWIPLFLLWPLLLVVAAVALVAAAVADAALASAGKRYHHYTRLVAGLFGMLAESRGTTVHVDGPETAIHIELR